MCILFFPDVSNNVFWPCNVAMWPTVFVVLFYPIGERNIVLKFIYFSELKQLQDYIFVLLMYLEIVPTKCLSWNVESNNFFTWDFLA